MLDVPRKVFDQLLKDPVMAAEVLMGWKLDTFQKVRLRTWWWVPSVIDSSGVSTGKTLVDFIYLNLRCILIPDHVAAVYFPNFQTGKDEFWPYFERTRSQSEIFAQQFVYHHGKVGEHLYPGAWTMDYKNGSRLLMPAPNFLQDSATQASRRFNTLMVDDWLRAEDMGSGIDKQLVDRTTRGSFNKNHRLWCNHFKFLGHAETPSHKGFRRYRSFRDAIRRDGCGRHALISFCFKDWSPKFQKFLIDDVITQQRSVLTRDQFRRQWLGLWSADGDGYYPEAYLERCRSRDLAPATQRVHEEDYYFFGQDTAPGRGVKSDYSALSVLRARPVKDPDQANFSYNGSLWHVAFVYSHAMRGRTAAQLSGWFYWLHQRFGFSWGVMDPGGGGTWVYDEMQKEQQEVDGRTIDVIPVCDRADPMQSQKQPILSWAKRSGELRWITNPQYLTGDDGLLDSMHRRYQEAWVGQQVAVPFDYEDVPPEIRKTWTPQQIEASKGLQRMRQELGNVRVKLGKDGSKLTSSKGFSLFESSKKKDAAYTGLYAFHAFLIWLSQTWQDGADEEDREFTCG